MGSMDDSVRDALEYHGLGWKVIPIPRGSKSQNARGWREWRYNEDQIRNAFIDKNIGVLLGAVSDNLIDIDLDEPIASIIANELMPDTLTFGRLGKPMSHRLYRLIDWTCNTTKFSDPITKTNMVEVRGDGGLTIFPGSLHATGELINWTANQTIIVPTDITKEQLFNYVALVSSATAFAKYWSRGSRHDTTLHLTGWLARNKMGEDEILSFVHAITSAAKDEQQRDRLAVVNSTMAQFENGANVTGYPNLREYVDERILRWVAKWLNISVRSVEEIASLNTTDEGNAERLIKLFGNDFKYCSERKGFYTWNGKHWEWDIRLRINRFAAETAKTIYEEAANAATAAERAELANWATQSNNITRLEAMVKRVMGRPEVTVSVNDFDADRDMIGLENGVFDLEHDNLLPHTKDLMITRFAPVTYVEDAPIPYLVLMLLQSVEDRDTLIAIQKGCGLGLSGRTDKAMFFCFGPTDTGKTTFLTQGMLELLGPYGRQVSLETIMGGRERSKEMYIASMHGARFALASEPPRNFVLDTSAIKSITGDSKQTARNLYEMPFESIPTAVFFVDTNYRPDIPDSDDAIWNRINLIYFRNRVKRDRGESGYIPNFKDKIAESVEMSGLLNWCMEGYRLWREEGLSSSEQMISQKEEYRESQDTVRQFIADCIKSDENAYVEIDKLFDAYIAWCKRQGIDVQQGRQSKNSLYDVLIQDHKWIAKRLIIDSPKGKLKIRAWLGVELVVNPMERMPYGDDTEHTFRPYSED